MIKNRKIIFIFLILISTNSLIIANGQNNSKYSSSINFYGEKTDVYLGEEIIVRLSIVNLDSNPKMHAQVIILPSSGMSVTSAEFTKVSAGQFASNYLLEPGDGRNIEIKLRSNQVGEFDIKGRVVYYFGDDSENIQDYSLDLPVTVRKPTVLTEVAEKTSQPKGMQGFEVILLGAGMIAFVTLFSIGVILALKKL